MKAVFSFWDTTGNALIAATNWKNPKFHLYSWVLAVSQAAKWFKEVEIVTDSKSAELFKALNLPITSIRTDLDELETKGYNKRLWALGKIKAYQLQDKPFVHIDNDFILFQPLAERFLNSEIVFQNKEAADWFETSYRGQYEHLSKNGILPSSWGNVTYALNCGIYLCNNLEYNKEYCKQAFELVDKNHELIAETGVAGLYCVVFEQYIAATVAAQMNIEPTYLSEPFIIDKMNELGCIHIWGAKHDDNWFTKIESIVKMEHPEKFELINQLIP